MKLLYIVRHAKSSWDHPELDDFERPLNDRGHREAIMTGTILKGKKVTPDLLISSPASRAAMTAKLLSEQIRYPWSEIVFDAKLYMASRQQLYKIIKAIKNEYQQVMIIGHNPALTSLVNDLADETISNLPTCGIYGMKFKIKSWKELSRKCGHKILYEYPKKDWDSEASGNMRG
jgi:phosphohistidine phosphatase